MKTTTVWTALSSVILVLALYAGGMNATNAGGVLKAPAPVRPDVTGDGVR
jgi:hypothetical protein